MGRYDGIARTQDLGRVHYSATYRTTSYIRNSINVISASITLLKSLAIIIIVVVSPNKTLLRIGNNQDFSHALHPSKLINYRL